MKEEYKRNCPNCDRELIYADKYKLNTAVKNKSVCYSCAKIGKSYCKGNKLSKEHKKKISESLKGRIVWTNPPMDGKKHSKETRRKISESHKGKKHSDDTIKKMIEIKKNISCETKKRMRLSRIKYINNNMGQVSPNFNPNACKIMDEYGKKHGYNFQHAMNGGEFYIEKLGYWVDGIDHNKKTIFEYYENAHRKKIKRDRQRISEIKKQTKYIIVIVREWNRNVEVVK